MNESLERLGEQLHLNDSRNERLRLAFGCACAMRVKHFLEDPEVEACLTGLGLYLDGAASHEQLLRFAGQASHLANRHQGSKSIDGCGHAAVSATYAVANALADNFTFQGK